MMEQIPEWDTCVLYADYVDEMLSSGEEPLSYFEWLSENQIEPV